MSPEPITASAGFAYAMAAIAAATAVAGGVAASKAATQNKLNAESEAEQALLTGQAEADRTRRENNQRLSIIRAELGAQGTSFEGSPMLAYLDNVKNAELQAQDALYAGQIGSRSKRMEAGIHKREAAGALLAGGARAAGSFASLGSTLLK